jgi:hypothetical protein
VTTYSLLHNIYEIKESCVFAISREKNETNQFIVIFSHERAHLQPLHRENFLQAAVGGRLEALIGSVAPFLPCARLQQKTVKIF